MVKIGFAVVALGIGSWIYFGVQRDQVSLPEEWRSDLDPAMAEAKEQKRPVILLIDAPTGSQAVRQMAKITLHQKHNREALKKGRYVAVTVPWTEKLGEQFNVQSTQLPTTIILDPNGTELRRRVGYIGEVPFRKEFLVLEEDGEGNGEDDES
jgi:thioredoxin-related protein